MSSPPPIEDSATLTHLGQSIATLATVAWLAFKELRNRQYRNGKNRRTSAPHTELIEYRVSQLEESLEAKHKENNDKIDKIQQTLDENLRRMQIKIAVIEERQGQ